MKRITSLFLLLALSLVVSGCVSTVPFNVKHDKLKNPPATRTGTLAIKPFVDTRSVTNAMQVGGKGAKGKPAYIAGQGRPVADIVTDGVREALEKVGYKVESSPSPNLPVLEGDMSEFWLTDSWTAVCNITVKLRLRKGDGPVLWEKALRSQDKEGFIIPNAMTGAMDTLLKSAMEEFSSQPFSDAVAGK
jgi:hypothetical protein